MNRNMIQVGLKCYKCDQEFIYTTNKFNHPVAPLTLSICCPLCNKHIVFRAFISEEGIHNITKHPNPDSVILKWSNINTPTKIADMFPGLEDLLTHAEVYDGNEDYGRKSGTTEERRSN